MTNRRLCFLSLVTTISVAASACTVEPVQELLDRGSWIPSDIDATVTIERFADRGYQMLCNAFESYAHDIYRSQLLIEAACTAHALRTTDNATDCAARTDECLDTLPPSVESELHDILSQAGCGNLGVTREQCESPVMELITCLSDLDDAIGQLKLTATCAAFGSPVEPSWWHIKTPPSCIALARSCH